MVSSPGHGIWGALCSCLCLAMAAGGGWGLVLENRAAERLEMYLCDGTGSPHSPLFTLRFRQPWQYEMGQGGGSAASEGLVLRVAWADCSFYEDYELRGQDDARIVVKGFHSEHSNIPVGELYPWHLPAGTSTIAVRKLTGSATISKAEVKWKGRCLVHEIGSNFEPIFLPITEGTSLRLWRGHSHYTDIKLENVLSEALADAIRKTGFNKAVEGKTVKFTVSSDTQVSCEVFEIKKKEIVEEKGWPYAQQPPLHLLQQKLIGSTQINGLEFEERFSWSDSDVEDTEDLGPLTIPSQLNSPDSLKSNGPLTIPSPLNSLDSLKSNGTLTIPSQLNSPDNLKSNGPLTIPSQLNIPDNLKSNGLLHFPICIKVGINGDAKIKVKKWNIGEKGSEVYLDTNARYCICSNQDQLNKYRRALVLVTYINKKRYVTRAYDALYGDSIREALEKDLNCIFTIKSKTRKVDLCKITRGKRKKSVQKLNFSSIREASSDDFKIPLLVRLDKHSSKTYEVQSVQNLKVGLLIYDDDENFHFKSMDACKNGVFVFSDLYEFLKDKKNIWLVFKWDDVMPRKSESKMAKVNPITNVQLFDVIGSRFFIHVKGKESVNGNLVVKLVIEKCKHFKSMKIRPLEHNYVLKSESFFYVKGALNANEKYVVENKVELKNQKQKNKWLPTREGGKA